MSAYIKTQKDPNAASQLLEKQEQAKPKTSRREIKIRTKINEIETKKTI
jgi:hypothetical protein